MVAVGAAEPCWWLVCVAPLLACGPPALALAGELCREAESLPQWQSS